MHCLCCDFPRSLLHKHTHFYLYSIYLKIKWLYSQRVCNNPSVWASTEGRLWGLPRLRVFMSLWAVLVIHMLYSPPIRTSSPCFLLSFIDSMEPAVFSSEAEVWRCVWMVTARVCFVSALLLAVRLASVKPAALCKRLGRPHQARVHFCFHHTGSSLFWVHSLRFEYNLS